jgi:LysR family glycine cleavage system transcriptional activator
MPDLKPSTLPPLKLLHTFDAAARHLSVTRAAKELNLTQAAVSRQIKQLEDTLQLTLFERNRRGLEFSDAGQRYFDDISSALAIIGKATAALRPYEGVRTQRLVLAVDAAFNARWLAPRLGTFCERHKDIEIEIMVTKAMSDNSVNLLQGVDAQVAYGKGPWPGYDAERLLVFEEFPVCSPALVERLGLKNKTLKTSILSTATLIHEGDHAPWRHWIEFARLKTPYNRGPIIHDSMSCLAMASSGAGFAIGDNLTCRDELNAGTLVKPFSQTRAMETSFYLLNARTKPATRALQTFAQWMREALA